MECGDTPHSHNIHMDTDMDMDMEYGSTWSVETLYIPYYPYGHGYGSMFTYYHCYIL